MQTTGVEKICGQVIWYNTHILPKVSLEFFDLDWHYSCGGVHGSAPGRGRAHFLFAQGYELVLRPFRRGGLIGKINPDLYIRTGATFSRPFREYCLLEWMYKNKLPVPRPVAARYSPYGLCYRADLVTQCIPHARPLADILLEMALPLGTWSSIGAVIHQMHALDVHHSDLNCRNILLDSDLKVWLIDFDKCRRRKSGGWKVQNLTRLKRSLDKENMKHRGLFWQNEAWSALLAGYETGTF